jgi:hypothetical protein
MALDETVKSLRALLERATPGPWCIHPNGSSVWQGETWEQTNNDESLLMVCSTVRQVDDAALIAEARNALPELLDAADLLCRLERMVGSGELGDDTYGLVAALEAARREQARERG